METSLFHHLVEVLSSLANRDFSEDTELYRTANLIDCYHSPSLVRLARVKNLPVNDLYKKFCTIWSLSPVAIGPNGFLHFQSAQKDVMVHPLPPVAAEVIGKVTCASFSDKWGTPRQGQLAPESQCILEIPSGKIIGTCDFLGVLWVPHLSQSKNPLQALVRPPKAHGNFKCGVFATRSPHRPSPVCLSIAKVEHISFSDHSPVSRVHLSGCDMTEGTPILDVFPYIPSMHAISNSRAPRWVREANIIEVVWGLGAVFDLDKLMESDAERARLQALVNSTLKQDPRSKHSKKQQNQPVHGVKIETGDKQLIAVTYQHISDTNYDFVRILRLQATTSIGKLRTKEWLDDTLAKMPFIAPALNQVVV